MKGQDKTLKKLKCFNITMHEILSAPRQKPPSDSFPKHLFFKYYRLQFAPISRCINMASFGEADSTAEANFCMFAASNKQNIK